MAQFLRFCDCPSIPGDKNKVNRPHKTKWHTTHGKEFELKNNPINQKKQGKFEKMVRRDRMPAQNGILSV
jgi:hypothetical protein